MKRLLMLVNEQYEKLIQSDNSLRYRIRCVFVIIIIIEREISYSFFYCENSVPKFLRINEKCNV